MRLLGFQGLVNEIHLMRWALDNVTEELRGIKAELVKHNERETRRENKSGFSDKKKSLRPIRL